MAAAGNSRRRQGASRRGSAADSSAGENALRWFGSGVLCGVLLSVIGFQVLQSEDPPATGAGDESAVARGDEATLPAPEIDFFDVLPRQRIEVEVAEEQMASARQQRIDENFLLQAGSFRDAADADRRRAELLLLGFDPRVEETEGSTGRWFRVLIGPFESRSRMAAARSLTAQQNIDTLLIRRSAP